MILRASVLWALLALVSGCDTPPPGPLDPIRALEGQWVVVNYWAEWCKPCIREIPELNALDALEGVAVLGVNYDGETGDTLADQEQRLGISFPTLTAPPHEALGVALPEVLPTTLVIAPDGALVETLVGPQTLESLRSVTIGRAPG